MKNYFLSAATFTGRMGVLSLLVAGILFLSVSTAFCAKNHACDYITKEEVEQVVGVSVSSAQREPNNVMGQNICVFDIPGGKGLGLVQLQMLRTKWAKKAGIKGLTAPSLFKNSMSFLGNLKEMEGLGDKAYWGGAGIKIGAGLHILYKDAFMTITVEVGDAVASLKKSRELAATIIKKLK
jgi:hypothetical protein